jgi:PTH1 family peptidyl-tRNA hydrolase
MTIKLIVGLRNPGKNYLATRHNAGGWFVEALAQYYQGAFKIESKLNSELVLLDIAGVSCRVMKPSSYMNVSGLPVQAVCKFYQIAPSEVLVTHDDLDLFAGRIKLKSGGGHGGHNGLRDIIKHLGSADFQRMRIGIGHPGERGLVLDYVLGRPSISDRILIDEAINRGVDSVPTILTGTIEKAMNQLNGES